MRPPSPPEKIPVDPQAASDDGHLPQREETSQDTSPHNLPTTSSSRQHPSWWRPDLAQPLSVSNHQSSGYLAKKVAGKRIAEMEGQKDRNCPHPKLFSGRAPAKPSSGPSLQRHRNRGQSSSSRRSKRREALSPSREHPRQPHPDRSKLPARIPTTSSSLGRRKRSFEESFAVERRAEPTGRDRAEFSRKNRYNPSMEKEVDPIPTYPSDSQATISDTNLFAYKAKQANVSPSHKQERPFRLNLQKKLGPRTEDPAVSEVTSGLYTSAKKSLTFEATVPAIDQSREKDPGLHLEEEDETEAELV